MTLIFAKKYRKNAISYNLESPRSGSLLSVIVYCKYVVIAAELTDNDDYNDEQ